MGFLKFNKVRKGITLIELIVTMALLSIVISLAINLFLFNNNVYKKSEILSQVQFDVRMASDFLTSELRNKSEISLTDNTLGKSLSLSSIQDKYPSVKSVELEMLNQDNKYMVAYIIEGSDSNGENEYTLENDVLLNNITSAAIGDPDVVYNAIYYE